MQERGSSPLVVRLATAEPPTLQLLNGLSDRVAEVLRELTAREDPVRQIAVWLVRRVDVGSLSIEVEGRPAQPEVSPGVIDGLCQQLLEDIQAITENPMAWSERYPGRDSEFLHALRGLGALSVEQKASLSLSHANETAEVGGILAQKVDEMLRARFQDWGTVEGHLEMVTLHRQRYFRIYPSGVTRGVECHFDEDLLPRVRELLGRRVSVWGRLRRSRSGSIEWAEVKLVEPLEPRRLDDIRPREPLWPGKSYEELHRWTWEQ